MIKVLKYIVNTNNAPVLFSRNVLHNCVDKDAISAGFLVISYDTINNRFFARCFGESTTLNIKSNRVVDKELIETFLNGKVNESFCKE